MRALRVVLDSNVVISGFLFGGPPARILEHALHDAVQAYTSLPILDEVRDSKTDSRFCGMLLHYVGGVHSKFAHKKYSFFHEIIIC